MRQPTVWVACLAALGAFSAVMAIITSKPVTLFAPRLPIGDGYSEPLVAPVPTMLPDHTAAIVGAGPPAVLIGNKPPQKEVPWKTENEAIIMAWVDLNAGTKELVLKDPAWPVFQRYLFNQTGDLEGLKAISAALNYALRGLEARKPFAINRYLIRIDLRHWVRNDTDLNEIIKVWEEFRFDPMFSLILTKDTLRFAVGLDLDKEKANFERIGADVKGDILRLEAQHLNPILFGALIGTAQTQAPIVHSDYFITRSLTTIKDQDKVEKDGKIELKDNVYSTLYGGLYYDLAGIKTGFNKGTDEDHILEDLGIGNVEQGVTADKLFEKLGSQHRAAMFKSGVTDKFRGMDLFQIPGGNKYLQICSISHDFLRKNIDIGSHAVANLGSLRGKDDAREGIFVKANGFHGFFLVNGKGVRQDAVPVSVATNKRIPGAATPELQPAIDCIDCHGTNGGWKPFKNDVLKAIKGGFDIFNDTSKIKLSREQIVNALAKEYTGDPEEHDSILDRARKDYDKAVFAATGTWESSQTQADLVKRSSEKITKIHRDYRYREVDATFILKDLNIKDVKATSEESLKFAIPPIPIPNSDGSIPEDWRIGNVIAKVGILTTDYGLVRSIIARRAQLESARKVQR